MRLLVKLCGVVGLSAVALGGLVASAGASPVLISNLTVDAKQTYYDNSNGTLAPLIALPAGATQLVFSFHGGVITDSTNQYASADGLYANGTAPYNFINTNFGTGTYQGTRIGATTGIDPAIFGVFFSPTFTGTPANSLDYRSGITPDSRTLLVYSPSLNQPFWIGDGYSQNNAYTSAMQNASYVPAGIQQIYNIPTGAQYLILGIGADINMADNQFGGIGGGQFSSTVPEPSSLVLLALGVACILVRRRKATRAAA